MRTCVHTHTSTCMHPNVNDCARRGVYCAQIRDGMKTSGLETQQVDKHGSLAGAIAPPAREVLESLPHRGEKCFLETASHQ